ncbi:hypothetical protein OGAPHI_001284 [Ogataea philodendri]|uniref:Uncharacterized protein n=1 Tax=Ogataea philodendri TaxID=1378263 RepID=A0A9P8PEF8_9ASCO|nr:uncharacterized protein OGAPHI_001284 [Ogataea philodendri]KAH3670768.1 hypothetical protein OGAPHI_001284 [Ogataea philodendri]
MYEIIEYRLVVVGPPVVGKSALTIRLTQAEFANEYDPTIEDSYRHYCEINGVPSSLDILDTAGQEEYSSMRDLYMKTGEGFLLVFSLTDRKTFEEISTFYNQIMRVKSEQVPYAPLILLGNKADLVDERQVSKDEAINLATKMGCAYIETSAKSGLNVTEAFYNLVKIIINSGYKHAGLVGTSFPDPLEEAKERQKQSSSAKKGKKESHSSAVDPVTAGSGVATNGPNGQVNGPTSSAAAPGSGAHKESPNTDSGSGSSSGGTCSSWAFTNGRASSSDRDLGLDERSNRSELLLSGLQVRTGFFLQHFEQFSQFVLSNLGVCDNSIINLFLVAQVNHWSSEGDQSGSQKQSPQTEERGQFVENESNTCNLQGLFNVLGVKNFLDFDLCLLDQFCGLTRVLVSIFANNVLVSRLESDSTRAASLKRMLSKLTYLSNSKDPTMDPNTFPEAAGSFQVKRSQLDFFTGGLANGVLTSDIW